MKRIVCSGLMALLFSSCTPRAKPVTMPDESQAARNQEVDRLVAIGDAYTSIGDSARAAQYYALALDRDGDRRAVFSRLLAVCVRDRQFRAALFYVENYLRRHPDDHKLRFVAGTLYQSLGEPSAARAAYEKALTGDPANADVHYAIAVLSRDQERDPLAADSHFREYLRLAPDGSHAAEARHSLLERVQ